MSEHRLLDSAGTLATVNAAIARLTFLTNGHIGRDWRSARLYTLPDKGSEWEAIEQAIDALRAARAAIANGASQ